MESRCIALLFLDHGTRRVSVTPRPLFNTGKDPVPIVQEAGWAPGPVWKGAENLAPIGIRSPERPGRSQSLYRLSYSAHSGDSTLYHRITRYAAYLWVYCYSNPWTYTSIHSSKSRMVLSNGSPNGIVGPYAKKRLPYGTPHQDQKNILYFENI